MASVILEQGILARLESNHRRVEVLDEEGCLRGFFVPIDDATDSGANHDSPQEMTLPAGVDIPFDHEEVRQALAEPSGRFLHDILADLRARS